MELLAKLSATAQPAMHDAFGRLFRAVGDAAAYSPAARSAFVPAFESFIAAAQGYLRLL